MKYPKNTYLLSIREYADLENISMRTIQHRCKRGLLDCIKDIGRGGAQYRISVNILSHKSYVKYFGGNENQALIDASETDTTQLENDIAIMRGISNVEREFAYKWVNIIEETKEYTRSELEQYCKEKRLKNPNEKISVSNIYEKRRAYQVNGITALIPNWGKHLSGNSRVTDPLYNRFKSHYLTEGGLSAEMCRDAVIGFARRFSPDIDISKFPSADSFMYRLRKEIPKHAIELRRRGYMYYRKKYEYFIPRDWSGIAAGKAFVSDHHKFDVRVINEQGKVVRPWVTAWRDIRSGIFVSFLVHEDDCNSDHIFYTFATAIEKHGIPDYAYMDNGKDYKVHDFAGKPATKIDKDDFEEKSRSLLSELKVQAIFALPYNAQAKPIERDFTNVKNMFCRFLRGYTGGNSTEKPEVLKMQEKTGNLISLSFFKELFSRWLSEYYHQRKFSYGEYKGLSRAEVYNKFRGNVRSISSDSLSFLLMRTSKEFTIGRDGINDNSLGVPLVYWAEEFYSLKGLKVYLRRHLDRYDTAWVFDAETNALVCKACLSTKIPGIAESTVDKQKVKDAGARKRRDVKVAKLLSQADSQPDEFITIENLCNSQEAVSLDIPEPNVIQTTAHDKALQEHKKQEKQHIHTHLNSFVIEKKERKLYHLNAEKEADLENVAQNS